MRSCEVMCYKLYEIIELCNCYFIVCMLMETFGTMLKYFITVWHQNPKVQHRPPLGTIPRQSLQHISIKIHLLVILSSPFGSSGLSFSKWFHHQNAV